MKKIMTLILCCSAAAALAACGGSGTGNTAAAPQTAGVKDVLEAGIAEAEGTTDASVITDTDAANESETEIAAGTETETGAEETASADTNDADARQSGVDATAHKPEEDVSGLDVSGDSGNIDVDLTQLSSTMVYSEVYNMLSYPDDYIGKTVKMDGLFTYFHDQNTDTYYFACIIEDATACCSQGIEFELAGDHTYPDDYPEVNKRISVTGTFETYTEGDYQYCTLRNSEMKIL